MDVEQHLTECLAAPNTNRSYYLDKRTSVASQLPSQPAGGSGRKAAVQQTMTAFADRAVNTDTSALLQAAQLRMFIMNNMSFATADDFYFIFFLKLLRPKFEPAGALHRGGSGKTVSKAGSRSRIGAAGRGVAGSGLLQAGE